mmetsp:Transcript_102042/g.304494  ORF Transcript_102042/g.304494 Transcript_102042/m.304494 type:complete len:212 (+) Transcript_102042:1071-1706(+)
MSALCASHAPPTLPPIGPPRPRAPSESAPCVEAKRAPKRPVSPGNSSPEACRPPTSLSPPAPPCSALERLPRSSSPGRKSRSLTGSSILCGRAGPPRPPAPPRPTAAGTAPQAALRRHGGQHLQLQGPFHQGAQCGWAQRPWKRSPGGLTPSGAVLHASGLRCQSQRARLSARPPGSTVSFLLPAALRARAEGNLRGRSGPLGSARCRGCP